MPAINITFNDEQLGEIQQEKDPVVQYFIIKKSLKMDAGKASGQCAHGARIFNALYEEGRLFKDWHGFGGTWEDHKLIDKCNRVRIKTASDSKFEKIKEEFNVVLVRDAGLTGVEPGSETVLVLVPMLSSDTPEIIHKLRLL